MVIEKNIPLVALTTFGVGGPAKNFIIIEKVDDIKKAFTYSRLRSENSELRTGAAHELDNEPRVLVLGGGSNMVVSDNGFDGVVLHIKIKDLRYKIKDEEIEVAIGAGENWDELVAYCVQNGWWGIENLSGIPGSVGAAPVQNIGAYGQEVSDAVERVLVYDRIDNELKTLTKNECGFKYRKSIFNTTHKGQYIILKVTLKLSKTSCPSTGYVDVKNYFAKHGIKNPTIQQIREAIISIRARKFTDPATVGTAGSFFKNLYISQEEYTVMHAQVLKVYGEEKANMLEEIKNKFPANDGIKIPAAFIIDKICGLKGARIGGAQVSSTQALAIINPDRKATSTDTLALIKKIRETVYHGTTMKLDIEPELVGFSEEELQMLDIVS